VAQVTTPPVHPLGTPPTPPPPQALGILTRAYGLRDARVAFALHNLGGFYLARRQLERAADSYQQALRLKLEVLGTGHRCGGCWSAERRLPLGGCDGACGL
jgi:tetratricopeptide (TPR) repeat protein